MLDGIIYDKGKHSKFNIVGIFTKISFKGFIHISSS